MTKAIQMISNNYLIDIYVKSVLLKVDSAFINLLENEMCRRNLTLESYKTDKCQNQI
ncbi:sporulation histidine kinase inhibitor Sda [Bacillus taeanensis]|uniref:Sporulation histidine kinase inhibitor Sda n=1 Tax=Bacillus taeanensis TaxID=273032 RepID=A0A366XR60_9BACI|nr:sporulation histidine kinase inhibitor Sda [Bacillus taeanensis]RBW67259.1 hypothetical protein DS031_23305 [Bacillus taeanensis]